MNANSHQLILTNKFGHIKITPILCTEEQIRSVAMEDVKAMESLGGENNKVASAAVILSHGQVIHLFGNFKA